MINTRPHSFLDLMAEALRCDYIRLLDDFHRAEPDKVVQSVSRHWLHGERRQDVSFWCREVEWSIDGRPFRCAVPVKIKVEAWGSLAVSGEAPHQDDRSEMDWLRRAIEHSRAIPDGVPYVDFPE